ncbi:hypothetical protein C8J57DRAFT_1501539 [Mycena rebaudengoi]|nr:hypothetical protein C8J57DRAFT_1501539 [Mycena rebaudengoi]
MTETHAIARAATRAPLPATCHARGRAGRRAHDRHPRRMLIILVPWRRRPRRRPSLTAASTPDVPQATAASLLTGASPPPPPPPPLPLAKFFARFFAKFESHPQAHPRSPSAPCDRLGAAPAEAFLANGHNAHNNVGDAHNNAFAFASDMAPGTARNNNNLANLPTPLDDRALILAETPLHLEGRLGAHSARSTNLHSNTPGNGRSSCAHAPLATHVRAAAPSASNSNGAGGEFGAHE